MRAMGFTLDAKFDLGTQIYRSPVGRWPWSALATSSDRQWDRASLVEDRGSDPSILGALQEDRAYRPDLHLRLRTLVQLLGLVAQGYALFSQCALASVRPTAWTPRSSTRYSARAAERTTQAFETSGMAIQAVGRARPILNHTGFGGG